MTIKKRSHLSLTIFIVTISMFLLMMMFGNVIYSQEGHNHDGLVAWTNASSLPSVAGGYYLDTDVTISSTWAVPSGTTTLCLNGHRIKMVGSGSAIKVGAGITLKLYDCDTTTEHRYSISSPAANGAGVATVNDALTSNYQTFIGGYITGGYITGGYQYGAGINLEGNGATLYMYGGTIIGNRLTAGSTGGGGVCVQDWDKSGGFYMYGGSIIGNTSNYGGGVYVRSGKMELIGGTISNNVANGNIGGGILVFGGSSTLEVKGGVIRNNTAVHGGAVEVSGDGTIIISGGSFTNNIATGQGGALTNQRTDGNTSPASFSISGAPIFSGNTAGGQANDVYLCNTAVLNLTAALTNTTKIGIKKASGTGAFTSGWTTYMIDGESKIVDPENYFKSDNGDYSIFLKDNEAQVGVKPHEHDDLTFTKWTSANSLPSTAGNYYLAADVTISSRWNVPSGVVNLCLNGHSITRTNASDTTGSVIQVGYGCTLNLYDCGTETRYYVVDNPSVNGAGLGRIVDESTYNATDENARGTFVGGYITGGNITGGIDNDHLIGGGVNVERGSFTMYGGTIIGNKVCINAGGVKVKGAGASFTMNGGAIIANYNDCYGGAISVGDNKSNNLCTVTINDGLIARNWSGRNAGAIHVDGYQHTLTITGGSIINNYTNGNYDNGSTGRSAGGILMEGINVTLSGNPVIKDNTQGGGFINNAYTRNSAYGLDLINGLGDDADVGVYAKGITNSSDIRVAINAQMEDIQHMHFDLPLEGGLVYCDGTNDYFYQNGEYIIIPNTHHTHAAGTIWASVEARSVVITYDANGGSGEMDDQVSLYSSVTIGANGYTYSGCVFTNWNTLADGSGETYVAGDTYAIENNLTLYAQWEHSHNDVTFQPWISTTSLPSTAGNYYLTADVTISSTWDVPDGTTNLCLNGFGIIKTGSGSVIKIRSGNTLNIYDCGTQEHKFTIEEYSRPNGAGKATVNDSLTENYQTFNGGYITGGENDDGGCITMIGGSLHLYGGNIIGNKGKTNGGAVIMNGNAVFIMYGGVIQYNYGRTGGAIFVENGSEFILEGGLISYNTSGVRAGAIFDRGSVKIRGGEISNNYNTYEKATINMWGGKIEITGGVVKDNIGTASHMSGIEFSDISLGGNPTFINNKDTNGNQSNFYVYTNGKINIISALDDNVKNNKIGITLQSGKGVVTNGWGTYMGYADPNDYFYSEIPGYDILLIRGEVRLATEPYYLIKFSSGEGSGNMYDDILEEGSQYTLPTSTTFVGLTGKALVGWKVGENTYSPGDVVTLTEDVTTFEALWTDGVTITFDSKGGNEIESQCILPNAQASIPEAPKKSGYKFLYWTLNGTEYNFSTQVTEDITLTALWAEQISTGESFENGLPNTWTVESTTNWTWLVESGDHSGANGAHTGSYNARTSGHADNGNESYLIMPTIDLTGKTSATLSFWYFNRNWSNDIDSLAICYRIDGGSWIQVYSSEGSKDNWTNVTIELPNEALTANVEIAFKATDYYGYGVALDDVLLEVVTPHTHSWSYAAGDNVITATCSGCEDGTCPVGIQTLTIDASSKTYDGTSVEATTSKSNGWTSENGLVTSHSVTYTGNTNAGTYTASITIENVTAEIEFEISKAQATVNITGNTSTIDYDGQVHTATGYVAESSTTLYDVTTDFTYTGPASISRTNAGTTYMELTADMFTNTNDNFDVVTFVIVADGYQTISPINVTVNVTGNNSTVDYDRQVHTVSGYVAEPSTTLFDVANDISYTGTESISRTNAGTTYMGLTTDMFANTNENFSEVTFVIVADGYQTINQITATVNITGNSSVLDYDGQEHTVIRYVAEPSTTVYDIANDISYTGPASISRTNAGTTYMGLTTDMFTNTNENFSEVTFVILADGYQTINQITATVNITGNNSTVPYDGQAHIVSGYTAEPSTTLYDVANDITYTGPESISRTNAGTTYLELTSNMFANTNENFSTVTFVVLANGYQTISPINITVNVKGNHNTRNYDGQSHTVTGYVAEASTTLYDVTNDFTFSGNASATRTDAGTSFMGLTYDMFTNTNENFAVVTFVVIDGYQTINPINATVKITGNNNITNYDGQEHEVTGYDAVSANTLYDVTKDFTFNGNATVSRTNAGTSYMGLTYDMFTNTNENFAIVTFIVIDGYQTVNPINVTVNITGNTSSIEYDGQAHTATGYVAVPSTTVYDVTKDFTYTGPESISRTNVGTTYMGLTPTMFANTNENFAVVTFVIVADGYQTITPTTVTVNVTGNNSAVPYDGQSHSVTGYVAVPTKDIYDVTKDFTFSGNASVSRTNAGTTYMELTSDMFANTNENFDVVTFVIVADGYQTISPINLTVNVTGNNSTVDYDGQEHTVSGYLAEASTTLYDVTKDFTFNGNATALRTNAGTSNMGLTSDMFTNTNENFAEVTFVIVDGYQTISPINVTVNVTGNNNTTDYDGQAHEITGYVAVPSTTLYDVTTDFTFSGNAIVSRTNAGTSNMGLTSDMFTNTNENFDVVTFVIVDGYQTITPINATVNITGNNSTVDYDGQAHTVSGYVAEANTTLYDVTKDFTYTGPESISRTNAGTTYMELTSSMFTNTNENFAEVTFVIAADGYQTISPINVTVNITGNNNITDYDGQVHEITGYVAVPTNNLYDVANDFTFSGNATASRTNAGTSNMGLTSDMFTNTNDNFATVTFVIVADGYQTVSPINLTVNITGNNNTTDYDGQAHTVSGYVAEPSTTLFDVANDISYTGPASISRTNAGTTYMGLTSDMFANTNDNFAEVTFVITADGYQTISPINATVNITGNNSTVDYDGQEHTVTGYLAEASTTLYDVTKDFTFSGNATASRTNAGTSNMGLTSDMFTNTNDNFAEVTFVITTDGYQTISPINATVNITGNNSTTDYDGQAHTVSGYVAEASTTLYDVTKDFTFSGSKTASRTNAGTTNMNLASTMFTNTNENFATVTFVIVADGYQTISPINVTVNITGNSNTTNYDGQEHTVTGYLAEASTTLYDVTSDFTFSGSATASRTNAGTTYMELTSDMFANTNDNFAEVTFVITADGYQTISPINVTVNVTGNNSTVDYDGQAHTVSGYVAEASTTLYDVTKDFTFSGNAIASRTNAGTTNMNLASTMFTNTNENFATVTFVIVDGYQTISPINVTINITGNNSTVDYDGQAHTVLGYVAEASTTLYDVTKDFTFSGNATASRTNAGTTYMGLTADMFANTNDNFATVTFVITADGYQTVSPINVTVNITGNNNTTDYDGQAHTVSGYVAEPSTTLFDVANDISYTGPASISRTNAGTTYMGLTADMFANTNENFDVVTFVIVTDGYQTISPINVTVNVTGNTSVVDYDGQAHIVTGYVAEPSTTLYDVTKDFTYTGPESISRTNVGTTNMNLDSTMFVNTNENFNVVTFVIVSDGYQTISPINVIVTVTGNSNTSDYDGQSHEVTGYVAEASTTLYDVTKDFTFSGNAVVSRTNAGTTYMNLDSTMFANTNENFAMVTFVIVDGYQTIKPINATITITGNNSVVDYDGQSHETKGYIAQSSTTLYDVTKDFTFSGNAYVSRTNAGTSYMGLTSNMFTNTNENFDKVTFVIVDGYQTIKPIAVTIRIVGHNSTVDYDGKEHTISGFDATADNSLYEVSKDLAFNGNSTITKTDASVTNMNLSVGMFSNLNANFDRVTFYVIDGCLTINPINVTVTIKGNTDTADYDGKAHTVTGYVAEPSSTLYDVTKDFTYTGPESITRTDAGLINMDLSADMFTNTNENFAKVEFEIVEDGYLEILKVDPIVKTAPKETNPKGNDSEQQLIILGEVEGGTQYYALGVSENIIPSDELFKVEIPTGKDTGNYYVWYKVEGDKNHNDLPPVCLKVTITEDDWGNIHGVIYQPDGKTPMEGATVTLKVGDKIVDSTTTTKNGKYQFNVPNGVYNIVVEYKNVSVTMMVVGNDNTEENVTMLDGNTKSILQVDSDNGSHLGVVVGKLEKEAYSVREADQVPSDKNVSVVMTVTQKDESNTENAELIKLKTKDKRFVFFEIKIEKHIDSSAIVMTETDNVLEIVIPYANANKSGIVVLSDHGGNVTEFVENESKAAGTFYVDKANSLVYIYTNRFSTFAIGYTPKYNVKTTISLGSFAGKVNITLINQKDNSVHTLNNVDPGNINFTGIPMGEYVMSVSWEDGVTNTFSIPLKVNGTESSIDDDYSDEKNNSGDNVNNDKATGKTDDPTIIIENDEDDKDRIYNDTLYAMFKKHEYVLVRNNGKKKFEIGQNVQVEDNIA